jgi:predicted phage terminase large subunit-like protein
MIFMPPRHGKSMLASEYFPAFYLGLHPDHQVITATYSQDLASDFGRKVRNTVVDPEFAALFPEAGLADDSQAATRFSLKAGGVYHALGVGGAATGRGAHLLLIDDPIKGREDAESEIMRQRLKDWYTSVARTRLMPGGAIVVIQTRWHEDDLAGWLLREHAHEGWEVINLPALAEGDDGRSEGSALWPECYPVEALQSIRMAIGERDWACLYQQRPMAAAGGIFKRSDWQYFNPIDATPKGLVSALKCFRVIQAWDTAFKTNEGNDYSACVTIGISDSRYYVLDVWRHRVEYPELKRAVVAQFEKWGAHQVRIEDTAAGQSIIQDLRRGTRVPISAVKADRDKVTRANAVTPSHEAGLVYIPSGAEWVSDFVDEMSSFPAGVHDDQVDAFVHAMSGSIMLGKAPEEPKEVDPFGQWRNASGGSLYGGL